MQPPSSSLLLDPAYWTLLSDRGRALADDVRNLYGRVAAEGAESGGAWTALSRALSEFGARAVKNPNEIDRLPDLYNREPG